MNIILLGAPGSGKGTTSESLIEYFGFEQLSTGDLFRTNISNNTELGLEAKKYMNEGKYVPDEITNGMVKEYLSTHKTKQIFDGYPRTEAQAIELDKMLSEFNSEIKYVIHIEISEDVLFERLTGRIICPICKRSYHIKNRPPKVEGKCDYDGGELFVRKDDQPDKIKVRLDEYHKLTKPLIDFYSSQNKLININAQGLSADELFKKVSEVIK